VTALQRLERKIGFQSLSDFTDIRDALDFAAANGFRALELNLGNPCYLAQLRSNRGRAQVRDRSRRLHIPLLVHSIEGLNLFLSDPKLVKGNVAYLKRLAAQCARAGVVHFTFHLGMDMRYSYAADERRYCYELFPETVKPGLRETLLELKAYSSRLDGMTLGIENVGGFRFDWVLPLLDEMLGGRLCLTMDIGHINVYRGRVFEAENGFFLSHPRLIRSSHVHDNSGERDQHAIIGEGNIDFLPYFRLIAEQKAYCIFEVRPREAAVECLRRFRTAYAPKLSAISI
jgi:sugar phosphate isomerase/epimerase